MRAGKVERHLPTPFFFAEHDGCAVGLTRVPNANRAVARDGRQPGAVAAEIGIHHILKTVKDGWPTFAIGIPGSQNLVPGEDEDTGAVRAESCDPGILGPLGKHDRTTLGACEVPDAISPILGSRDNPGALGTEGGT